MAYKHCLDAVAKRSVCVWSLDLQTVTALKETTRFTEYGKVTQDAGP